MRLRNKKTGDILPLQMTINDKEYQSLAEFSEDWEDYKPSKPLIKDEKIRKAVRAWAEAIKTESVFVEKPSYVRSDLILSHSFATISFPIDKPKELNFCETYSIAELCGEEKECEN